MLRRTTRALFIPKLFGGPAFFAAVLLLLLLLTACAHRQDAKDSRPGKHAMEEMRVLIRETIQDSDRAALLLALVEKTENQINQLGLAFRSFQKDMQALNKNYDATVEDFETLLADFNPRRKKLQQEILASVFMMKALTRPEEWKILSEQETKTLFLGVQEARWQGRQGK
jgi:septal ring factor EnvC (AmiA/AmiB activator)